MPEMQTSMKYERKVTPLERFFTRSPFSIVTLVVRIKGHVSENMLRAAVRNAQQRHVLLRVRIQEEEDREQWFTSDGAKEIPIAIIPRKTKDDWIDVHAEASMIPFDFEARPAIRFILVQSRDVSELIILCHHMICDGMSLAYLARDLMTYLGDPDWKDEPLTDPSPMDLDNLPLNIRSSGLRKTIIQRMNQKWAVESEYFDQQDYEILTKTYWDHYTHAIFSIELTEEETSSLVDRCRKELVTVNSALAAAFTGAQGFIEAEKTYHPNLMVATNVRERIRKHPGEAVGYYAAGLELKFKYNHRHTFWENARKFHKKIQSKYVNKKLFSEIMDWLHLDPTIFEAMNVKKLGKLVVQDSSRYEKLSAFSQREDVVSNVLKRGKIDSLERVQWGTAVTNLGHLDFPRTYGALELERLILQPGGGLPLAHVNLVLGAVTCSGKLSLIVEYAQEVVDTETMAKIKDQALAFLLS